MQGCCRQDKRHALRIYALLPKMMLANAQPIPPRPAGCTPPRPYSELLDSEVLSEPLSLPVSAHPALPPCSGSMPAAAPLAPSPSDAMTARPHVTGAAPSDWRFLPAPWRRGKRVAVPRARVNGRGPACEGPANGREALMGHRAGRAALLRARATRTKRVLEAPSLPRYSLCTHI